MLNVAADSVLVALLSTHAKLTKVKKVGWERLGRTKNLGSGDRRKRARRNSKIERQLALRENDEVEG